MSDIKSRLALECPHQRGACIACDALDAIASLERELAEARVENVDLLIRHRDCQPHCQHHVLSEALASARAEVEAAARWFHKAGRISGQQDALEWHDGETFAAAWSRYQQERQA